MVRHVFKLVVVCALLSFSLGVQAAVVPAFNGSTETRLLAGKLRPSSGILNGAWNSTSRGLELVAESGEKWATWFPAGGAASLNHGTVRVQLRPTKKANIGVLFRATEQGGQLVSGYRARLEGRRLSIERIKKGKARTLPGKITIKASRSKRVELLVSAFGSHLVVQAWDPKRGTLLGMTYAKDRNFSSGRVGLTVRKGASEASRMTLLATRKACDQTPVDRGGPALFVTVLKGSVSDGVLDELMETLLGKQVKQVWRADTVGLERLHCKRTEPLKISLEMPWKYRDPLYRRYRNRKVRLKKGQVVLDRSYKNPVMVERLLRKWNELYPDLTRLEQIGESREGRPINAIVLGRGLGESPDRPTFFLNGAHHGNEVLSHEFVLDAVNEILMGAGTNSRIDRWLDNVAIWAVPVVNPDGLHAFLEVTSRTGRKNGRDHNHDGKRGRFEGVDLNRNYPFRWGSLGEKGSRSAKGSVYYRGPSPASEPEVQAVMELANREQFAGALTYHTGTVALLAPYTIDGVQDPIINEAWEIAEELAGQINGYPKGRSLKVKRNLYPVDGTDQDWHRFTHGTVALLVEGVRLTPETMKERNKVVRALRPLVYNLLDRFLDGPSVSVIVTDSEGRPVKAEVVVNEMAPQEGERWMTRCPDGRHDRYLTSQRPERGVWTIEVRAEGLATVVKELKASDSHQVLRVEMDASTNPGVICEEGQSVQPAE